MRFSAQIISLCHLAGFLSLSTASPNVVARDPPSLVQRDLATITGILGDVGSGIEKLDSAAKSFSGSSGPLLSAAESLVSVINEGNTKAAKSSDLSLTDALGLQDPVKALTKKAQTLTDDLKAKRPAIEKGGFCSITRSQITQINSASQKLIKTIVSKVPEEAQGIASNLASGLTDVLNEAQDDFSEKNCVDQKGASTSKQVASSTTEPATGTSNAGSLPSTADTSSVLASEPASTSAGTAAAPSTSGGVKPYPPVVPTTAAGETPTATPTPPIATAGAALIAPAGALALGIAAVLI